MKPFYPIQNLEAASQLLCFAVLLGVRGRGRVVVGSDRDGPVSGQVEVESDRGGIGSGRDCPHAPVGNEGLRHYEDGVQAFNLASQLGSVLQLMLSLMIMGISITKFP